MIQIGSAEFADQPKRARTHEGRVVLNELGQMSVGINPMDRTCSEPDQTACGAAFVF